MSRQRFTRIPQSLTVPVIIFLNFIVFVMWFFAARSRPELYFMAKNFLVSWTGLEEGRYWILLTSAFSHNMLFHFLINMLVLNSFAPIVEMAMGRWNFIKFYLVAAIVSSFCHAFVSFWLLAEPNLPALGASGAVAGIVLLFSLMFPKQKILIFGIIPMPAIWGALAFVALDVWGLIAQAEGGGLPIGHGAHLGGAAVGIIYYVFFLRGKRFELQ